MTDLFPDVRPGTDDDRRRITDEVYRRNTSIHRTAAKRAIEDVEAARLLAHDEEYCALRDLAFEAFAENPDTAVAWIVAWLHAFGERWAQTETDYFTAMEAAMDHLERLEQQ